MYSDVITKSSVSWTSAFHGNFRWLAPELLGQSDDGLPVRPTNHTDIYSFGGIMLQVCLFRCFDLLGDIIIPTFRSSPIEFPIIT